MVYKRTTQARNAVIQRAEELKQAVLMSRLHYSAGLAKVKLSV